MTGYYEEKLSALHLKQCYDIAPPRVKQYLESELIHVVEKIKSGDRVLELGCGYGRILPELARKTGFVVGIDNSLPSLELGKETLSPIANCGLMLMDAVRPAFQKGAFDVVVCIQNGISAFHVDQRVLLAESMQIIEPGGILLFSSYSQKFWKARLEWFRLQAATGLLGEIDEEKTGNGLIVCKDGFTASTIGPEKFQALTTGLNANARLVEVDESSLFCEISC